MREKITAFLKAQKKERLLTGVLLAALVLVIFWPTGEKKRTAPGQDTAETEEDGMGGEGLASPAAQMEQALSSSLSRVEGVGSVQVAITLESTSRKVVEKDVPEARSSQTSGGEEGGGSLTETSEEATVYERDGDGAEVPYVVSEEYPAVRGVLVIAEGGDDPVVVREIQEAVMALFQVEAHKIKVMKMK